MIRGLRERSVGLAARLVTNLHADVAAGRPLLEDDLARVDLRDAFDVERDELRVRVGEAVAVERDT